MTLDELKRLDPNRIGSWPILPKLGVLLLLLLVLVFVSYWFDWQDQITQIDGAKAKEEQLRTTFLSKKKQAIDLPAYRKQLVDIESQFGALLKQLPGKSEMDALLTDINQAGLGRGLEFDLFKPSPETMRDFYAELPITVRITGSYHDLGRFASDVAQLPRIVTLNNLAITQTKDGVLTLDAVAMTYRYLDEEELAKVKKAAKDSKGGNK